MNFEIHKIHIQPRAKSSQEPKLGTKPFTAPVRPEFITPALSAIELLVWNSFFVESYSNSGLDHPDYHRGRLDDYDRCMIPIDILRWILRWQAMGLFDELEIRTQGIYHTAALFGHRGPDIWLLARWREDNGSLMPFEAVKDAIKPWLRRELAQQVVFTGLFALMSCASFLAVFLRPDHVISACLFGLVMLGGAVCTWTEPFFRARKVLQALRRHCPERA